MKQSNLLKALILASLFFSAEASAKMCKGFNTDGQQVFMWATDAKTGKLQITQSASGLISTMEACPQNYNLDIPAQNVVGVRLRPQDITKLEIPEAPVEQTLPEDRNAFLHESCKRTLSAVCDPSYGGLKLYPNPSIADNGAIIGNCIGFKIESGTTEGGEIKYAFPSMYSAMKERPDGTQYCEFDK